MINRNPWRGLASYEEPQGNEQDYLFCGRDEETLDLVRLIDNNLFVTLYGSSGIGKTSLLKAGVIPILRRKNYFPVYVRLSQENKDLSYAESIVNKLKNSGLTIQYNSVSEHHEGTDKLYLWNYFATTKFFNITGREVYPVIILDQFEEVFRNSEKNKAELLLKQIYLLINDELEMPDKEGYSSDTNYRFVASIREDYLFVLEDSIDEFSLDLYKNNRYRLRPMKPENAKQVVLVPGKDCIDENEKDAVVEKAVSLAKRNKHGDIDTILLSLVCAGSFEKKVGERIKLYDLSIWKNNPMDVYYHDAVKELAANQIRYIQKNLIRDDGSRRRVDEDEVKKSIGEKSYNTIINGENRLLRITEQGQVELMHDMLALAVFEEKKAFEERERKKKLRRKFSIGTIIVLFVSLFIIIQNIRLNKTTKILEKHIATNKMLTYSIIGDKVRMMTNQGDSYGARKLLLSIMHNNIENNNDIIPVEIENSLRYAILKNNAILDQDYYLDASFSSDGKKIASITQNMIKIWDTETGELLRYLDINYDGSLCRNIVFDSDDNRVYVYDGLAVKLWNLNTNTETDIARIYGQSGIFAVSHDFKKLVIVSDKIILIDIEQKMIIKEIGEHIGSINTIDFSPDDDYIVLAGGDDNVIVLNIESGLVKHTFNGQSSAAFNPDGKRLVSTSTDGFINIWDVETGDRIYSANMSGIPLTATYSPNGNRIVVSLMNKIIVLDAETKQLLYEIDGFVDNNIFTSVNYSSDGKKLVATAPALLAVMDMESEELIRFIELNNKMTYTNWKKKITRNDSFIITPLNDYSVETNNKEMPIMKTVKCCDTAVDFVQFCSDGKRFLSESADGVVQIWSAETMSVICTIDNPQDIIITAAFNRSGDKIVTISNHSVINIWNTDDGSLVKTWVNGQSEFIYPDTPTSIAFSPDEQQILMAIGNDNEAFAITFDINGNNIKIKQMMDVDDRIKSLCFSKDLKRIAALTNDQIFFWDTNSGTIIDSKIIDVMGLIDIEYIGPEYIFINNNPDLIAVNYNSYIGIYCLKNNGAVIGVGGPCEEYFKSLANGYRENIKSFSLSSSGDKIVAGFFDGSIRIWYFPPLQELIDQTRERFKNNPLTEEERRMYYLE